MSELWETKNREFAAQLGLVNSGMRAHGASVVYDERAGCWQWSAFGRRGATHGTAPFEAEAWSRALEAEDELEQVR